MSTETVKIKLSCKKCGGPLKVEHEGLKPNPDSEVSCSSCGNIVGRYDLVRSQAIKQAKTEIVDDFKERMRKTLRKR